MKKANKDALPPLMLATDTKPAPFIPNVVTPIILKPEGGVGGVTGSPTKSPNMHLLQTADGKKILLTNVVGNSKVASNRLNQFVVLSNTVPIPLCASFQSQLSTTVASTKVKTRFKPVTSAKKPVVVQQTGVGQSVPLKQDNLPTANIRSLPVDEKDIPKNVNGNFAGFPLPLPLLKNSVISASDAGMYINNGFSRFKVVGKPVPVTLAGKASPLGHVPVAVRGNPSALFQNPVRIAPKGVEICKPNKKSSLSQLDIPLPPENGSSVTSPHFKEDPPKSSGSQPSAESGSPGMPGKLPSPPAYLNIQVKNEPQLECNTKIKLEEEGPMSILDVRIKEESGDEQSALLANDEQLRDVLNVAPQEIKGSPKPRLYIRTPEGKLISITPEEAETMGLNHKDSVEDNQKRLVKAFQGIENLEKQMKAKPMRVLIPNSLNVEDFVSRNVPEEAKKNAALMRNIGIGKVSGLNPQKEKNGNPVIVGEITEDDKRYLRIRIEPEEFDSAICDIPISPFNTYYCPFCKKEFKAKDHVISHIRIHTGERPYPCEICGKRYRQRIDIIRHMRIHTGEKPFICGLCNASFNQKSNLRSHMRIHTGERPVQCKVCGKDFSRNTHLKQHLKLHTGEKPYKCKVCCRPFRFKSGLQAHERIHTGLKPYACSLCGRSFTQIVGLIRHERTHEGEKPFRCQHCGKSFDARVSLQVHCRKHTDERPYACHICSKTFTDNASLRSHIKKYHANTLICLICHKENFKSRVDLREHMREHERNNWQETADGDLVPSLLPKARDFVSIDDVAENTEETGNDTFRGVHYDIKNNQGIFEEEQNGREIHSSFDVLHPEEIQVEVELDPDDPMEGDDDDDSEYEDHDLLGVGDPLAC